MAFMYIHTTIQRMSRFIHLNGSNHGRQLYLSSIKTSLYPEHLDHPLGPRHTPNPRHQSQCF